MAGEDRAKAFDFAQETSKQLLGLSTGVITLTLTLLKDVVTKAPHGAKVFLFAGWGLFLVSILAGVAVLMTLTGNLGQANDSTVYTPNVKICATVQILAFVLAMLAVLVFGIWAL